MSVTNALSHDATILAFVPLLRGHGSNYFECCHTAQHSKGFSARAVPAGVAPSATINTVK